MSKPRNTVGNNLCITEEDFESFQANTAFEETEYIVLSDIVPQEEVVIDQTAVLAEMPSDEIDRSYLNLNGSPSQIIEVETSDQDICTDQDSKCLDPVVEYQEKIPQSLEIEEGVNINDPVEYTTPALESNINGSDIPKTAKKRGRKKKSVITMDKTVQNTVNDSLKETPSSTEKPITRRGRRRKKSPVHTLLPINYGNGIDKLQNPPKRKRGRPRKNCPDPVPDPVCLSPTVEQDHKIDSSINCEADSSGDGEDMILSKLKEMFEPTEKSVNQNTDVSTTNANIEKAEVENIEIDLQVSDTIESNNRDINKRPQSKFQPHETLDCENLTNDSNDLNSLLVEDSSKRPRRRKTKKLMVYEEESDEDPFANMELSDDDEPKRKRKGKKYYSDDEYVPGKQEIKEVPDSSDSDIDLQDEESKPKRRKYRRDSSFTKSPIKKGGTDKNILNQPKVTTIVPDNDTEVVDDFEDCLQSSVIKATEALPPGKAWATSNAFENFIAQKIQGTDLKIKKVSSSSQKTIVAPLDIPSIDPNERKKTVEVHSQTKHIEMVSQSVQTNIPNAVVIKKNKTLTPEQSLNACDFLISIVKTTAELGQLLTNKSQEFMKKKINTMNITDAQKIDYCVKKSFLLFKLAKSNLSQMEEDLANQYNDFLNTNGLSSCMEQIKTLAPKEPQNNDDSDCEIVDVRTPLGTDETKKKKEKFNPKTVFLNKELSIKIAKKPAPAPASKPKEKFNVAGRHTVWINENIMVKKVNPNQSFLAQDSRNKKPPDTHIITNKMVSDFFHHYNMQRAFHICALYASPDWLQVDCQPVVCNYFVVNSNELQASHSNGRSNTVLDIVECTREESLINMKLINPKSLLSLCTDVIHKHLISVYLGTENNNITSDLSKPKTFLKINTNCDKEVTTQPNTTSPKSLLLLCTGVLQNYLFMKTDLQLTNIINSDAKSPRKLNEICLNNINNNLELKHFFQRVDEDISNLDNINKSNQQFEVLSLKALCYKEILDLINESARVSEIWNNGSCSDSYDNVEFSDIETSTNKYDTDYPDDRSPTQNTTSVTSPKTLKSLSLNFVREILYCKEKVDLNCVSVNYEVRKLASICFDLVSSYFSEPSSSVETDNMPILTINTVNTVTEEDFRHLDAAFDEDESYDNDGNDAYGDDFGHDNENIDDNTQNDDDNWESRVQMEQFRTCLTPDVNEHSELNKEQESSVAQFASVRVKAEPPDEVLDTIPDPSLVKIEPIIHHLNEMTIVPDSIITKLENQEYPAPSARPDLDCQNSASFDQETFESFVSTNKMMHALDEPFDNDEIFSQSALRIRRQHRPDSDDENDYNMSLLVPQAFEPLSIDTAKGSLMESSDEDGSGKKTTGKKKLDKRKRGRKPNNDVKSNNKEKPIPNTSAKSKPVEKILPNDEVSVLTRRMREKIRQEEKKNESSDSDTENLSLNIRKETDKRKKCDTEFPTSDTENVSLDIRKVSDKRKRNDKTSKNKKKNCEEEIQCSNVDSTEKLVSSPTHANAFSGFSAVDQNEISNYEKYVKFVYSKILPVESSDKVALSTNPTNEETGDKDTKKLEIMDQGSETKEKEFVEDVNNGQSFEITADEPAEELECEPALPIFDELEETETKRNKTVKKLSQKNPKEAAPNEAPTYTDRHGWHCYPVDSTDLKLYQSTSIPLEKLPEAFVETYFEYQEMTDKDKIDEEVARLTNLQSLNRLSSIKDGKSRDKRKVKTSDETRSRKTSEGGSRSPSPLHHDNCDELTPSEDEGDRAEDETPPPMPLSHSENNMAKDLLMNDNDSDGGDGVTIKTEPGIELTKSKPGPKCSKRFNQDASKLKIKIKIGPKSQCSIANSEPLMLTADKMMNKELNLLHAPVVLDEKDPELPVKSSSSTKKRSSGLKHKSLIKTEDDYSSEEEKQWVNTKEKLLKRMVNKQDSTSVDDAKRAKLVSEFIERRGDGPSRKRPIGGRRKSRKSILEQQKQHRVLSKELFGEYSGSLGKTTYSQSFSKGRRNIRKVIDKKSLARSTVIANMEEFERKRRINARQAQLRELLGCEDGVNVLVINDEVCLEYDFEELRPIVSVHPFFTKVMKAHQYEGVKFMWDACFESLSHVESGRGGGGCILAHCMGLGKTLQVLALLHTVLTHPRAGMKRVLVCCPLSTVLNWVDEIHKWIGPVTKKIKVFELSKLKKTYERAFQLEDWYSGGGIFIIGYELFRSLTTLDAELDDLRPTIINKIRTALLDPGPDIIVCDEGHLLKNDCSVLAVAMSRVATKRRIVLTGTPMQNNLREYYCMVNFVKPNLLGTYSEYSNRFENPIMNGQHRDSSEEDIKLMKARTHILHKVLEGCLQRQEASVLYPYLPKKHEYTVFVSMTKCQWDLYKHYMAKYGRKKQNILKDFHVLQKIWSHPQVLHSFQMKSRDTEKVKEEKLEDDLAREDLSASVDVKPEDTDVWWLKHLDGGSLLDRLESSNKFHVVFNILQECLDIGDKVLIFSTSLITMDSLEFFLKKINNWSLGHEYYRLDGSVPAEVRQKWCREFNAEHNVKTKLFLISTRAGCLGLNMTAANRVIILDTSWNPAHDIQSIFRVYRFGQKKDCYIYRLVALGTMEQKIYERSVTKQAIACRVVDEQQIDRHYNSADLNELYKYDESGRSVAGGVAGSVRDVVLLRVARLAALHAATEHDSLLRGSAAEQALPEHERRAVWRQFQQEQARKQEQNELAAIKTEKQNLRRLNMTSKVARVKTELEPPSFSQPFKSGPKLRKNRNDNLITGDIPEVRDVATPESNMNKEDDLVRKITNILIKHNYQNRHGPKEISDLVANVRHLITSRKINVFSENNDMVHSIARVLIEREGVSVAMPPLSDIREPTSILPTNEDEDQPLLRKRGRPKKKRLGRPRKEREVMVENETIEIDDDDDDVIIQPTQMSAANKPQQNQPSNLADHNQQQEKVVSELKNTVIESIRLSDDDEPPDPVKVVPAKQPDEIEAGTIPLHLSLLKNPNFIKIVAHTYLTGNPMLDEDAATLAAQYSTMRALREAHSSGRAICSGPIYDIAVKVLGMGVLQKLHNSAAPVGKVQESPGNDSTDSAKSFSLDTTKETAQVKDSGPKSKPGPLRFKKLPHSTRISVKSEAELSNAPVTQIQAPLQPSTVVPVDMYELSMGDGSAGPGDECILPDDERPPPAPQARPAPAPPPARSPAPPPAAPRIVSAPIPAGCLQPSPIKHKMSPFGGSKKIPFIVHRVGSGPNVQTVGSVPPPAAPPAPPAPTPPQSILSTICLDSDDEDEPALIPLTPITSSLGLSRTTGKVVMVPASALKSIMPNPSISWASAQLPTLVSLTHAAASEPRVVAPNPCTPAPSPRPTVTLAPRIMTPGARTVTPTPGSVAPPPLCASSDPPSLVVSSSFFPLPPLKLSSKSTSKSNTTQESKGTTKNTTKCKPGDIIRIGKGGQLEVLEGNTSAAKQALQSSESSRVSRRRAASSSSSSGGSRAASPDPLSILRDVVHIQAAPPDKPVKTTPVANKPHAKLPQATTNQKSANPSSILRKIGPKETPKKSQNNLNQKPSKTPTDSSKTHGFRRLPPQRVNTSTPAKKSSLLLNNKIEAMTSKPLLESVDLTIVDTPNIVGSTGKKTTVVGIASASKNVAGPQKVVGTAKNMVLTTHGKNIKIETVKKNSNPPPKPMEAKKRAVVPTPPPPAAKKKKTEQLTLKDFDIDDINDIIELE